MVAPENGAENRVGCLHCGEQVLDHARICAHCKASALVDVVAATPLDDRTRYGLGRALVNSPGGGGRDLTAIQRGLRESPPVLAMGVTRDIAAQLIASARGLKVEALENAASEVQRSEPKRPAAKSPPSWIWIAAVIVIFLPVMFSLFRLGSRTAPTPAPTASAPVDAQASAPNAPVRSQRPNAVRDALNSVVAIRCGQQSGSGFYVGEDLVLTNNHVLCGAGVPVQVSLMDGRRALGIVQRTDPYLDLGLVRVHVSGVVRPLEPGDAAALDVGRTVYLIGSPEGLDFTFHEGKVSRVGQPLLGLGYVQIDARVNPGNSGGPLIDEQGRVVGVVSMKIEGDGLGLALPINYAFDYKGRTFLPPPSGWTQSPAFTQLSLAAEVQDTTTESLIASSVIAPFVVKVKSDQYARPVIIVGRLGQRTPPAEDFKFLFHANGAVICTRPAHTARWEEMLQTLDVPPRLAAWMREHRVEMKVYTTEVSPGLSGCPDFSRTKVTIDLEGGQEFPEH